MELQKEGKHESNVATLGRTHWHKIALGAIVAVATISHILWITKNQAPILGTDHHIYLRNLLRFLDSLRSPTFTELWDQLGRLSVIGRPPLYQLLTAPLIVLFGRSESAALLINSLFFGLLLLATYNLGCVAKDSIAGLLAVCVAASSPPILHVSRMYLPHLAVAAMSATTLWLLLLLTKTRSVKIAWALGFSLAVGLMLHPYYAWTLAAPTIIVGAYLLLFQLTPTRPHALTQAAPWFVSRFRDRFVLLGLLPAALIAIAPFLLWYLTWGLRSLEQMSVMRNWPRIYAIGFPEIEPSFWWYAQTAPGALSRPFCLLAICGLVFAVVRPRLSTSILLLAAVSAYATYSLMPTRWWVHFSTVVPVLSVLIGRFISRLRPRWLRISVIGSAITSSLFLFYFVDSGARWAQPVAIALGSPLPDAETCTSRSTAAFCPAQAKPYQWPWREILLTVSAECQRRRPCTLMIVEKPILPMCAYYLAQLRIENVIPTSSRARPRQYNFESLLGSDYILITQTGLTLKLWDLPEDNASRQFLEASPVVFSSTHQYVASFELPGVPSRIARLMKRVKPLTAAEAEEVVEALELPEEWKTQSFSILARLYATEGDLRKAKVNYDQIKDVKSRQALRHFF